MSGVVWFSSIYPTSFYLLKSNIFSLGLIVDERVSDR